PSFLVHCSAAPGDLHSLPTRRSSDLAGIVTEAVLKYGGVQAIGLCNGPINLQINIAKRFGVDYRAVDLDYVGLNHLSWVRKVWVDRKSTRLNSSHVKSSYAVFRLKKK